MFTSVDIAELQHVYAWWLVDIALALGEPVRLDQLGLLEGDFDDLFARGVDVEQFIADAAAECEGILADDIASLPALPVVGSDDWIDGRLRLAFRHLLLSHAVTYLRVATVARYFGADYEKVLAIAREEIAGDEYQDAKGDAETAGNEELEFDHEMGEGGDAEPDVLGAMDEGQRESESVADTAPTEKLTIAVRYLIDHQSLTSENVAGLARHFAVSRARVDQLAQTLVRRSAGMSSIPDSEEQEDLGNVLATNTDGWVGVAGMQGLKAILERDVIGPLQEPELYKQYRLTVPNGFLFYGPPGCGKTFIARKLADRLGRNFREFKPSDLASIYIHGSQELIKEAFAWAGQSAPSLLFFDEFDAMVPRRDRDDFAGKHQGTEVNEFLAQLNECASRGILVVGATNQADKIDQAVLRPGRLDKKILVPPPDEEARRDLFDLEMKSRPQVGMDWDTLAQWSDGHTCAEIADVVNDAARRALADHEPITMDHMSDALRHNPPQFTQVDFARYARIDAAA